jgi:hypothetical protein
MGFNLKVMPERLAVCRLPADAGLPQWAVSGTFRSASWTQDELSIVCEESSVPEEVKSERGWRCFMIEGPLDFRLTGVLLAIVEPLAKAGISIFAVSTFDTDYVLVKDSLLHEARRVLVESGHTVR